MHGNLQDLVVGPVTHDFHCIFGVLHRDIRNLLLHFGSSEFQGPVHARQPAPGDQFKLGTRSESVRQIKISEFPVLKDVEQCRGTVYPLGKPWRCPHDRGNGFEHIRTRVERCAVVNIPVLDLRIITLPPLVDQRVHCLEPATGVHGKAAHFAVRSRQLRRLILIPVL